MTGPRGRRDLVVRTPNHLGDLVMALPALAMLPGADVLVARWLAPLVELAKEGSPGMDIGEVIPFDRGTGGLLAAARELRGRRYRRGVLLAPSFSAALVFALGRVPERRGAPSDSRGALLTERAVFPGVGKIHRAASYVALATDEIPARPPVPALAVPERHRQRWRELVGHVDGPLVGVFPGCNAPSRRWEADRYAELVRHLGARGLTCAVFGGAGERALTALVAGERAIDLGGRTDLPLLAAGLAECEVLVTNDSGPMHLAAAVGTATVSLQGPADPTLTRPLGEGHVMLWGGELPCIPCVRNECPRSGPGYRLPTAERECMRLIEVDAVEAALARRLSRHLTGGGDERAR